MAFNDKIIKIVGGIFMGKKILKIIISFVIIIAITFLCYQEYRLLIENDYEHTQISDNIPENKVEKDQISKEPIFSLEEYPKVDASLATQPLTNAFIKNFTGENEISDEKLDYTNTHPGYIRLIDGEVDLIIVTEPSTEELEYAKSKNVELEVIPVVREGFVFYVNAENPVDNLSLEQIQNIYQGKITNWKDIGGTDNEIKAFQRPKNSGSQTGMLSLVMKDKKIMEPPKENLVDTMFEIINLVSSYDNGLNSIGYSYYYYATTMFETIDKSISDRIKLLKINEIAPNNETIKQQQYPLETAYYIVVRKYDTNSNTRKLVEAMLSERGQAIAEEAGYVSVK